MFVVCFDVRKSRWFGAGSADSWKPPEQLLKVRVSEADRAIPLPAPPTVSRRKRTPGDGNPMLASSGANLSLCDSIDWRPPGASVHGISQARILKWVAISSYRGSSRPRV